MQLRTDMAQRNDSYLYTILVDILDCIYNMNSVPKFWPTATEYKYYKIKSNATTCTASACAVPIFHFYLTSATAKRHNILTEN